MTGDEALPKTVGVSDSPPRRFAPGIFGVLAVILAAFVIRQAGGFPVGPDAGWQSLMASHQWAPSLMMAKALAFVGSSLGAALVTGAALIIHLCLHRWRMAIALTAAVGLGAVGSTMLKVVSERPRPSGGLLDLTTFSFPSGHTTWAAAFAATLALGLPRVWTMIAASGWIAFMAWSRTYLGVHWLSDVAAGALLGISLALIVDGVLTRLSAHGKRLHADVAVPGGAVVGRGNRGSREQALRALHRSGEHSAPLVRAAAKSCASAPCGGSDA
jgi:membrane-associated phospholipid phosphatase